VVPVSLAAPVTDPPEDLDGAKPVERVTAQIERRADPQPNKHVRTLHAADGCRYRFEQLHRADSWRLVERLDSDGEPLRSGSLPRSVEEIAARWS
jgi:hypothetical protein